MGDVNMKKIFLLFICVFGVAYSVSAQDDVMNYRRSSIYRMVLTNDEDRFYYDIMDEFERIEMPDKFNDHSIGLSRLISNHEPKVEEVSLFLEKNQVAKRLVAKWFDRNKSDGTFDAALIQERGFYNASVLDVALSSMTKRGNAALADAGKDLIGNTFVTVNYISYIDKERKAEIASTVFNVVAAGASTLSTATQFSNSNISSIAFMVSATSSLGGEISDLIAGFTVQITTFLYKLEWNDDIAGVFYDSFWCDETTSPEVKAQRKKAFEQEKNLFKLKYVGSFSDKSQKTVLKGLHDSRDVIRKVCARTIDKNTAELQRSYDVFKVKVPVIEVSSDGKSLLAPIGMKEAVDAHSKFEVLQMQMNNDGSTNYRRVGTVVPVSDKIWDNRYMATEEEAEGATLGSTTFKVVSGSGFFPGMLLREIK